MKGGKSVPKGAAERGQTYRIELFLFTTYASQQRRKRQERKGEKYQMAVKNEYTSLKKKIRFVSQFFSCVIYYKGKHVIYFIKNRIL